MINSHDLIEAVINGRTVSMALDESKELDTISRHHPDSIVGHPVIDGSSLSMSDDMIINSGNSKVVALHNSDLPTDSNYDMYYPITGGMNSRGGITGKLKELFPPQYNPEMPQRSPITGKISQAGRDPKKPMKPYLLQSVQQMPEISVEHYGYLKRAIAHEIVNHKSHNWFPDAHGPISDIFDSEPYKDSSIIKLLYAATSPREHPYMNAVKGTRAFRDIIVGRPLQGFGGNTSNIIRAAHGLALSGAKVNQFGGGLLGDTDTFTLDRQILSSAFSEFNNENPTTHHWSAAHEVHRKIGRELSKELGMDLSLTQIQSALWAHTIRRNGANDPYFHQAGSEFSNMSRLHGGYLPPTDVGAPIQSFGGFLLHNYDTFKRIKQDMDNFRLNHKGMQKLAGMAKPFFFSPHVEGTSFIYGEKGKEVPDATEEGIKISKADLGGREIERVQHEKGYVQIPKEMRKDGTMGPLQTFPYAHPTYIGK